MLSALDPPLSPAPSVRPSSLDGRVRIDRAHSVSARAAATAALSAAWTATLAARSVATRVTDGPARRSVDELGGRRRPSRRRGRGRAARATRSVPCGVPNSCSKRSGVEGRRLREEREDAAAVVVDDDDAQVDAAAAQRRERAGVVDEGDVAEQRRRSARRRGRRRAPWRSTPSMPLAPRLAWAAGGRAAEPLEVAHRHRRGDDELGAVGRCTGDVRATAGSVSARLRRRARRRCAARRASPASTPVAAATSPVAAAAALGERPAARRQASGDAVVGVDRRRVRRPARRGAPLRDDPLGEHLRRRRAADAHDDVGRCVGGERLVARRIASNAATAPARSTAARRRVGEHRPAGRVGERRRRRRRSTPLRPPATITPRPRRAAPPIGVVGGRRPDAAPRRRPARRRPAPRQRAGRADQRLAERQVEVHRAASPRPRTAAGGERPPRAARRRRRGRQGRGTSAPRAPYRWVWSIVCGAPTSRSSGGRSAVTHEHRHVGQAGLDDRRVEVGRRRAAGAQQHRRRAGRARGRGRRTPPPARRGRRAPPARRARRGPAPSACCASRARRRRGATPRRDPLVDERGAERRLHVGGLARVIGPGRYGPTGGAMARDGVRRRRGDGVIDRGLVRRRLPVVLHRQAAVRPRRSTSSPTTRLRRRRSTSCTGRSSSTRRRRRDDRAGASTPTPASSAAPSGPRRSSTTSPRSPPPRASSSTSTGPGGPTPPTPTGCCGTLRDQRRRCPGGAEGAAAGGLLHRRRRHRRPRRARRRCAADVGLDADAARRLPRQRRRASRLAVGAAARRRARHHRRADVRDRRSTWSIPGAQDPDDVRPGAAAPGRRRVAG